MLATHPQQKALVQPDDMVIHLYLHILHEGDACPPSRPVFIFGRDSEVWQCCCVQVFCHRVLAYSLEVILLAIKRCVVWVAIPKTQVHRACNSKAEVSLRFTVHCSGSENQWSQSLVLSNEPNSIKISPSNQNSATVSHLHCYCTGIIAEGRDYPL